MAAGKRKTKKKLGSLLAEALRPRSQAESLAMFRAFQATQPFPHFEAVHGRQDFFVRIDADGTRTMGRRVGREWRPVAAKWVCEPEEP